MKEASDGVALSFEGDTKVRLIRTLLPPMRNARWSVTVNYVVRVPRGVNVKIGGSKSAERIRVVERERERDRQRLQRHVIMEGVVGASGVEHGQRPDHLRLLAEAGGAAQVQAVNADIDM